MAKLNQTRGAQYVMEAQYVFNFDDTAVNASGNEVDFGKTTAVSTAFDIIDLPVDATVVGGSIMTETAFNSATSYNVSVGDANNAARYLAAADRKGLMTAPVPLVPTGLRTDGIPIRLTIVPNGVCTTGKMTVRVQYTVGGRVNETSI